MEADDWGKGKCDKTNSNCEKRLSKIRKLSHLILWHILISLLVQMGHSPGLLLSFIHAHTHAQSGLSSFISQLWALQCYFFLQYNNWQPYRLTKTMLHHTILVKWCYRACLFTSIGSRIRGAQADAPPWVSCPSSFPLHLHLPPPLPLISLAHCSKKRHQN